MENFIFVQWKSHSWHFAYTISLVAKSSYEIQLESFTRLLYSVDTQIASFMSTNILHLSKSLSYPFAPNAPSFKPLKTLENCKVFWCFQGEEKGCIGNK